MNLIKKFLGNNSWFIGESFHVGKDFKIGSNNIIRVKNFIAGDFVTIGSDNNILISEFFKIGNCGIISNKNDFTALNLEFGDYIYLDSNVLIGHGGKFGYSSTLKVGKYCMICANVRLNVNYPIEIGDNVGIGENVDFWTHGSFLPVLSGFPSQFGPISVGSNVWITSKCTILPNVKIGDNIVFSLGTVVNRKIANGSLCAGNPVKILHKNLFPTIISVDEKCKLISDSLDEYKKLMVYRKNEFEFIFENLYLRTKDILFDFNNMEVTGELGFLEEDLRDFLRRRGFKFYTGKPFKSILPPDFKSLLDFEI
jgi:acetyltransferase-like isoleucine patch superfamily enzyme